MNEDNPQEIAPFDPSRNRSNYVGYFYVVLIFISFVFVYSIETYVSDFFQISFFHDSTNIGKNCEYQASQYQEGDTIPNALPEDWQKIRLPHNYKLFDFTDRPQSMRSVYYRCNIDPQDVDLSKGTNVIHIGWVYGQKTTIYINDSLKVEFNGNDKPLIPIHSQDLQQKPLVLLIHTIGPSSTYIGVVGKVPPVLSSGFKTNNKVMGLETALQTVRYLFSLLPMLTLGVFFAFGWLLGVRSRLIMATFFYFSLILFRNLIPFCYNYLPIQDIDRLYDFQRIFEVNSLFALLIFGLELLSIQGAKIRYYTLAVIALTGFELSIVGFNHIDLSTTAQIFRFHSIIYIVLACLLIIAGIRKCRNISDSGRRKINYIFLGLIGLSTLLVAVENLLFQFGIGVILNRKLDVLMPIFTSGIVIYTITLIEKAYRKEKEQRTKMESDLKLAKEIQDSLAPPPPETEYDDLIISCYQIKHSQVAGDWMAVRKDKEKLIIVQADVTGKGVQAALVVHAIQSLWAEALGNEILDIDEWIHKLNRTLCTLGQRRPHSATLGIIAAKDGKITYWSQGHLPIYAVVNNAEKDSVKVIQGRGSILGINLDIQADPVEFNIQEANKIDIYLGTDGIFSNGSRTKPREVINIHNTLKKDIREALDLCDINDDRTLIHLRRKND